MEAKKRTFALLICLVLFLLGCILSMVFSWDDTAVWQQPGGSQVVLSEILAKNRTCPGPGGTNPDFVELRNLSESPVDISGYMISDSRDSIGYTFPDGTILEGRGYAVCWCIKDSTDPAFGNFGISSDGKDTIYLYNRANVIVDQQEVPVLPENHSLIHTDPDIWAAAPQPTPGFENTEEGYRQWVASLGMDRISVVISEMMTDSSCVPADPKLPPCDWVELKNTGDTAAVLDGAYLSDDPEEPLKWQIPGLTLEPGQLAVIPCSGGDTGAPFALSRDGCTVTLSGPIGNLLSQVECPALDRDVSWMRNSQGDYERTDLATPGFENTPEGYGSWMDAVGAPRLQVVISEVCPDNRSQILGSAGTLCDWVELTNQGSTPAVLDGAWLSDDMENRGKWQIPGLTLEPGQQAVIPCAGNLAGPGEADFGLPRSGCTVVLSGPAGSILSKVSCPATDRGRSWAMTEDGTYQVTDRPTPGYPNTEDGFLAFRSSRLPAGSLAISEVMPANGQYLIQADGNYYDWVELKNSSSHALNLSGYFLSNDKENLQRFPLPDKTLDPGERTLVICSGKPELAGRYIQAPFTLSREEAWLYLTDADGAFSDCLAISGVPADGSFGRNDDGVPAYFASPTPGSANGQGLLGKTASPRLLTEPGVQANGVSVEISGSGTLHYTLDGSRPTEDDPVYEGPLQLDSSAVVTVTAVEEGYLPADPTTGVYLVTQPHTLPVVCLSADPRQLFGENGIYGRRVPETEIPCNLQFLEQDGRVSAACGLEMLGAPQSESAKNSFRILFRGRFGGKALGYPLFGPEGTQVFRELRLEAPNPKDYSMLRDALCSGLCRDFTDQVPCGRSRFCVLYLNGEYWGIYKLEEAPDALFYGELYRVPPETVTTEENPPEFGGALQQLLAFAGSQDLSVAENAEYLRRHLDVDGFADWLILRGYLGSSGISRNLRYFHSPETRWKFSFSHADGCLYTPEGFGSLIRKDSPEPYEKLAAALMETPGFRQQFLDRMEQARTGTLSTEHVLEQINALEALLEPEMARECARWGGFPERWRADVQRLRDFAGQYDRWGLAQESLRQIPGLTAGTGGEA